MAEVSGGGGAGRARGGWRHPFLEIAARLRAFTTRFELYDFGRWLFLASLVGVVAGLGAALLTWGIEGVVHVLHHWLVGFHPPGHGEISDTSWLEPRRPWVLLIIMPAAGLIVGWLVQRYAPEAEGHGTDAVIRAFHRERSLIRKRVGPLKLIASALTIGSGGSAGREGPVAQVGAGFASHLARVLGLTAHERRTLVVAGMAAGIGGMFRAPLGGALFAIDVLYSENDFESEALIPSLIASIVAYVVNASLTGWGVIFRTSTNRFTHPVELLTFLVLGMVLALVGIVYVKTFYWMRDSFFGRMPGPVWIRPAVGGLLLAALAMFLPQVMGGGYGWLQLTLDGQLPLKLLLLLVPAKILATTFTISSGGSGGVFAPSLVIGGMTGAVFADVAHRLVPSAAPETSACVLVGMGAFFAGVANVPIASLILVAEMSGSYKLLVPMMLVGSVTFLLTRGVSIYDQQVPGRVDSPAHLGEFEVDILERMQVREVLDPGAEILTVDPSTPFPKVLELIAETDQTYFPLVDGEGRIVGMFSTDDVRRVLTTPEVWSLLVAGDLGVSVDALGYLLPDDDLHTAIRRFTAHRADALPVVQSRPPAPLLGMLTHHRVLQAYDEALHMAAAEREEA